MGIKERLRNPFVQQYLMEILLPIIGYYFFGWSLVIIAVFYLIDQIGAEYSFVRKFRAVRISENKSSLKFSLIVIIFFLFVLTLEVFLIFNYFKDGNMDAEQKIIAELTVFAKEELWILLPLIILMYHIKDQFTFFIPRRYLMKMSERFYYGHLVELTLVLIIVVMGCLFFANVTIADQILLFIFLTLKLVFDFTIGKLIEKKSEK